MRSGRRARGDGAGNGEEDCIRLPVSAESRTPTEDEDSRVARNARTAKRDVRAIMVGVECRMWRGIHRGEVRLFFNAGAAVENNVARRSKRRGGRRA
jgi:hypothetical protein